MKTTTAASAARWKKSGQFATQTVVVDDHWKIVRVDEKNWEIRHDGKFAGYYGTIINAFQGLPKQMLNHAAAGKLEQILEAQTRINSIIESSLKFKLA